LVRRRAEIFGSHVLVLRRCSLLERPSEESWEGLVDD